MVEEICNHCGKTSDKRWTTSENGYTFCTSCKAPKEFSDNEEVKNTRKIITKLKETGAFDKGLIDAIKIYPLYPTSDDKKYVEFKVDYIWRMGFEICPEDKKIDADWNVLYEDTITSIVKEMTDALATFIKLTNKK